MKKVVIMLIAVFTAVIISGCSAAELEYDANLGYDLNKVKSDDISFNIYHSATEDNSWELLASVPCKPEEGEYSDVKVELKGDKVTVLLEKNTYTEEKDSVVYGGTSEKVFEYKVDESVGSASGYQNYPVKDMEGEQLMRLYPISYGSYLSFAEEISLDEPYELQDETIDNILITIVMK